LREYELIIIGGGSAGLAATMGAYENGLKDILLIEREPELGGILLQCIHNGFGLHMFDEELAGPTYAERWINKVLETDVEIKLNTAVLSINNDLTLEYSNEDEGYRIVKAKSIVLAMGCRERSRGAIAIPGYRPAGVLTAGTAQKYVNILGNEIGKKVFILGSGDIGLIMARRMRLEGAEVVGVAEIMPYSNGLPRNVKQCLDDYNIPLYLSHTVTFIDGHDRVNSITISKVDDNLNPLKGTEKILEVDTLLLSVGLIPENDLSEMAGIELEMKTNGPIVDDKFETSIPGIFACGNVLHVHDLVDYVSKEALNAGKSAAEYVLKKSSKYEYITVTHDNNLVYILPNKIINENENNVELMYRVKTPMKKATINLICDGMIVRSIKKANLTPSIMGKIMVAKKLLKGTELIVNIKEEIL